MPPWFRDQFPLYLAPLAGVTETFFLQLAKPDGVEVMVSEFVSAEGIFRRNEHTMEYLDFVEEKRPLGVQLFGADPEHLGEAARIVIDWKRPAFLDLNFGVPGEQSREQERRFLAAARACRARRGACGRALPSHREDPHRLV